MSFFKDKIKQSLSKKLPMTTDIPPDFNSNISLNLGDFRTEFSAGKWVSDSNLNGNKSNEIGELQSCLVKLKEENDLLKLKNEILLQMLIEEENPGAK